MLFYEQKAIDSKARSSFIKSIFLLSFANQHTAKKYHSRYHKQVAPFIVKLEIITLSIQICNVIINIIMQFTGTFPEFPYISQYILLAVQIAILLIWTIACYKFKMLKGYAGTVYIIVWFVSEAEYMILGRTQWVLCPTVITTFIGCIFYGTILCDYWIKSSLAYLIGSTYFALRTLLKLELIYDSLYSVVLGIVSLNLISSIAFHYIDYRNRMDYLFIYDDQEITKFTSKFIEEIPIGIIILREQNIIFANREFGNIFSIAHEFPIYNCNSDDSKNYISILTNVLLVNSSSNILDATNIQTSTCYEYKQSHLKISSKNVQFGGNTYTIYCFLDITELRKLENEKTAKKYQTLLMATMSHELRTPLNGILGTTQMLLSKGSQPIQNELSVIHSCSTQLLMKVNDMLDFAQNEMSTLKLYNSNIEIRSLLHSVSNDFTQAFQLKGVELNLKINENVGTYLYSDEKRLKQVLHNIIGNAGKYTFSGSVNIDCTQENNSISFTITDTGVGIKEDIKNKLFCLFQSSANQNIQSQGIGLGLYISNIIVKMMGGKIDYSSQENKGSMFVIKVPYQFHTVEQKINEIRNTAINQRILIVDDNSFNLIVLEKILAKMQLKCTKAMNGEEAVKMIIQAQTSSDPINLVLMDCNMPVMDGYEATKEILRLRNSKQIDSITIVGVTAYTSTEHLEKCIECGMKKILCKPVNYDELKSALNEMKIL